MDPRLRPRISAGEFALLRDLIARESGIDLGESKMALLVARLGTRLRTLGMESFGDYYEHLMRGHAPGEIAHMLDRICTNETRFFRERKQFDFLEAEVLPPWRREADRGLRPKRIRAWSAACSSGEEAYSLAMSLLWHLPKDQGWRVEVLGSDLSTRVLEAARGATWSIDGAQDIPHRYLRRFMRRGTRSQDGLMGAGEELRSAVRFDRVNLNSSRYAVAGSYDVIFCRNVLIYFGQSARTAVLGRIAARLAVGGYLMLGHAESPGDALDGLQTVRTMIYRAAGPPPRRSA